MCKNFQILNLGSVIVNDYKHLKETGDLNRHDWRFRIAFPKLETFCTSQKGPYFLTNFFKSTLGFRTANIDGDLTSLVNKNGALLCKIFDLFQIDENSSA